MIFSSAHPTNVRTFLVATLMVLAVALGFVAAAGAVTYYVDNQHYAASPFGPGTEAQPYNTISNAIAAHKGPGVTIVVKPGVYREQVTIPASGASDAPFVIKASGPGVIVDGADSFAAEYLWAEPGAATVGGARELRVIDYGWLAASVNWPVLQVFANGRRLRPATGEPEQLSNDAFTWVQGEGLYVNVGGDNPGRQELLVGRRANAFKASGKSWVTIDGFDIRHTDDIAISLVSNCTDMMISNNRVSFSDGFGIRVSGCQRIRIDGNIVSDAQYHGIGLTSNSTGCVIRKNSSFRNADPTMRRAVGIYLFNSPNNVIEGNKTYENQDTGIQFDAGADSCMSYNNRSYNNGDHGFDHLDATNTVHVNEVAYHNLKDGFSVEGTSPGTQLYNCVGAENGTTTGEFDLWVNTASSAGFVSDYNLFWNSNEQFPIKYGSTKYWRLSDYQAASGQDGHSVQANPLFTNPGSGNFMPLSGSPLIDAGTSAVASWPVTDQGGNPRFDVPSVPNQGTGPIKYCDIGSDEFIAPDPALATGSTTGSIADRRLSVFGDQLSGTAGRLALSPGFPNPARGAVEFVLDLPQESRVEWAVYDVQGRVVWSEGRTLGAGRSQLRWDGTGSSGEPAANGVYLVQARVEGTRLTRRVVRF